MTTEQRLGWWRAFLLIGGFAFVYGGSGLAEAADLKLGFDFSLTGAPTTTGRLREWAPCWH